MAAQELAEQIIDAWANAGIVHLASADLDTPDCDEFDHARDVVLRAAGTAIRALDGHRPAVAVSEQQIRMAAFAHRSTRWTGTVRLAEFEHQQMRAAFRAAGLKVEHDG